MDAPPRSLQCNRCGNDLPPGSRFCPGCGVSISVARQRPNGAIWAIRWLEIAVLVPLSLYLLVGNTVAVIWLDFHLANFKPWETILVVIGVSLPPLVASVAVFASTFRRFRRSRVLWYSLRRFGRIMLAIQIGIVVFYFMVDGWLGGGSFLF